MTALVARSGTVSIALPLTEPEFALSRTMQKFSWSGLAPARNMSADVLVSAIEGTGTLRVIASGQANKGLAAENPGVAAAANYILGLVNPQTTSNI